MWRSPIAHNGSDVPLTVGFVISGRGACTIVFDMIFPFCTEQEIAQQINITPRSVSAFQTASESCTILFSTRFSVIQAGNKASHASLHHHWTFCYPLFLLSVFNKSVHSRIGGFTWTQCVQSRDIVFFHRLFTSSPFSLFTNLSPFSVKLYVILDDGRLESCFCKHRFYDWLVWPIDC